MSYIGPISAELNESSRVQSIYGTDRNPCFGPWHRQAANPGRATRSVPEHADRCSYRTISTMSPILISPVHSGLPGQIGRYGVYTGGYSEMVESLHFGGIRRSTSDISKQPSGRRYGSVRHRNRNRAEHPTYTADLTRNRVDGGWYLRSPRNAGRDTAVLDCPNRSVRVVRYRNTPSDCGSEPYIATERRYCGRSRACTPVSEVEFVEIERVRAAPTRERLDHGYRRRKPADRVRLGGVRPGFVVGPTLDFTRDCLRFR